ncbi:MAG: fatty acid desaturase [Myxococcota bacterium]
MLRFREDIRSLTFVAIQLSLCGAGFLIQPESWVFRIALVTSCCLFSFFCAVITHNTVHVPMFRRRGLNRLMQVVLTLCYGHPVSAFVPGHNLSHHVHTQSAKDVMRTTKLRFRWNLLNQIFFLSTISRSIIRGEWVYTRAMRTQRPRWFRQLILETIVYLGFNAGLIYLDWHSWLLYVFIPHQYAAWGIVGINFIQHDGCNPSSPYNHSRNFVGRWVNWWTFNNGFHGMHHLRPGLHWSLLPREHARVLAPHIHPNLEQTSLLAYAFQAFVWPGKRLDYLGNPVVLPPSVRDEDWVPNIHSTPAEVSLGAEA